MSKSKVSVTGRAWPIVLAVMALAMLAGGQKASAEVITDGVTFGKPVYSTSSYGGQMAAYSRPQVKYVQTYVKPGKTYKRKHVSRKNISRKKNVARKYKNIARWKGLRKKARGIGKFANPARSLRKSKYSASHKARARSLRKAASRSRGRSSHGHGSLVSVLKSVKPRGLPMSLAMAVVTIESGWRVHARGSSGERGLMQLMPATARRFGARGNLYNPRNNMKVGTRYLHWCYRRARGNVAATIGCYNRGPALMWSWSRSAITRRYVGRVRRYMRRS